MYHYIIHLSNRFEEKDYLTLVGGGVYKTLTVEQPNGVFWVRIPLLNGIYGILIQ